MKKTFFILFLINLSCSSNKKFYQLVQLEKIEKLIAIEPAPPRIAFAPAFVICKDGSVAETNFVNLKHVYEISYTNEFPSYADFLFQLLNQKQRINVSDKQVSDYFRKPFLSDSSMNSIYDEEGINGFAIRYCKNVNGYFRLNKQSLTANQVQTVSYYFFINGYFRYDDDYGATSDFKKLGIED